MMLAAGKPEEAAEVIEAHRERTEGETRAERELDLADIYLDQLSRPAQALKAAAILSGTDTLTAGQLIPGFEVAVSELFRV